MLAKRAAEKVEGFVNLIKSCRKETKNASSVADSLRFVVERINMKVSTH